MARIVVVGAGVVALGAAMLLAGDGHQVIVLERDPEGPPGTQWRHGSAGSGRAESVPDGARLPGRFRAVLEAELPAVSKALQDAGGLRQNFIRDVLPAQMTGGWQDGDECYEWLTGRRVLVEAVLPLRPSRPRGRGSPRYGRRGLTSGASTLPGVPHVTGVRTKAGVLIG